MIFARFRAISIHALREEGDAAAARATAKPANFYPRPPRGGRPPINNDVTELIKISIHALREEGDRLAVGGQDAGLISIHALREEGDISIL